ncbi:MAG: O-acetyl-ADP-ribose deacetylase, partial [Mesorhizobium sp.]
DCRTIAFPAISTGIYGYPKDQATEVAVGTVAVFLGEYAIPETVTFCCFDDLTARLYSSAVAAIGGA